MKLSSFIFFLCLLMANVPDAIAQERSGYGNDESLKNQDEIAPHVDSHLNNTSPATSSSAASANSINKEKEISRDTVSVKPAVTVRNKADSSAQKKTEEETLSFNLLYFIIQKFKVSDIMN